MAFTFDPLFAQDPNNPNTVAKDGVLTLFDPADPTKAPITITDPTGSPLPNPITVDAFGMGPAFQHPTLERVGWFGAGFTNYLTSYEGMKKTATDAKDAAQAAAATAGAEAAAVATAAIGTATGAATEAATSANAAATAAANAAALVGAPADAAIAAAVNGTGATKAALSATTATQIMATAAGKFATGAALTKTAGALTVGLGDSLTDKVAKEQTYFEQACLFSGGRVVRLGNAGVSGNTVQQMLARLQADVISLRPDRVLFKAGTNNMPTAQGYIDGQAAYTTILDTLLAAGIAVHCVSIPPRTDTQAVKDRGIAWNAWTKAEAQARGLLFIDTFPLFADGTGGWADAANTMDGIHLTEAGAKIEGKFVAAALAAVYPVRSPAEPARTNDTTNLLANALLIDSDDDGKPDGMTATVSANNKVRATIDPGIVGNVIQFEKLGGEGQNGSFDLPAGSWAVGDRLAFSLSVYTPANRGYSVYLGAFNSSNAIISFTYGVQTWGGSGTDWATPNGVLTVPAGTAYVRFMVMQFASGVANGSIYVGRPAVRLVDRAAAIVANPAPTVDSLGVTGLTHRWVPYGQVEAAGAAVPTMLDRKGTMNLTAMASGTRAMRSDALGKYVENSGVDNSGFQGSAAIPAGPKTLSLVVKTAAGSLSSYVAQVGGFGINRGGSIWQVFQTGTANNISVGTATGNWDHIILVWDGTTATAYLNGVAAGTTLAAEGTITNTLLIKGAGQVLHRELATFDHAFTAGEITAHRTALKAKWTDLP